ncbi:MAG TPA: AAA family ATPase [Sphingobacteriaceae bacterium]|nr:AAA family ATPase [Sphingobacteriaceae bacterium]
MQAYELLRRHFPWEPTGQQKEALTLLIKFLEHKPRYDCFILRGYAGTGKTTIISALVRALPRFGLRSVLLAPTGRAAKVMGQYSGRKAQTIHKKIYRKKHAASPDMNFDLAPNMHEDTLFIIDEASMISDERTSFNRKSVLEDLIRFVRQGKRCLLLFVGDTAQLPPVGLQHSPALEPKILEAHFMLSCIGYELREVVRQAHDSGILANATWIRQQIHIPDEEKVQVPRLYTKSYPDVFRFNGERLIDGLNYAYTKFGMENTLVICRSNKHANLYNQHIRHQILFREDELSGGDHIMVVKNNYYWLTQENPESDSFIANGDMAQVRRVRNVHEQHGFRFADVSLEFSDMEESEAITCRVLLDTLHSDSPNLSSEDHRLLYARIMAEYAEHTKDQKELHALIKSDPYYNALQIKFSMAITCHKAQGGQWEAVFVDQGYLQDENMDKEFLRWLYTAVTRATKELYLVNFNEVFFVTKSTSATSN